MMLDFDDTMRLYESRLLAQYSLAEGGMITVTSAPDTSGCSRVLNVSPEWLFLFLEAEWFQSCTELRGLELSRALKMKGNACKLLSRWLEHCAGSSGTLH